MKKFLGKFGVLINAAKKFDQDHGFLLSAGITFNILLCFIPLALLLLSVIGTYLFTKEAVLKQIRNFISQAAPSLDPGIMENISTLVQDREIIGVLGIAGLIWTSTWVFASLRSALNIVMKVEKERSLLQGKAVDILMIFLVIIFLLISMALTSFVTFIENYELPFRMGSFLQWLLKYILPFFFTYGMFFLIYKIIPNRRIHFKTALLTALFTSVLWEAAKQFFGWYILHLGRFSVVYGSLSTLIIFFFWLYYSSAILLMGGEVAYFLESARERSEEPP
jgi:membrane protein